MAASASYDGGSGDGSANSGSYECNICLDSAKDPVVSLCGHLFCWSCLHRWMDCQLRERGQAGCPVCKAVIDRERVVPLYGRGGTNRDPRTNDDSPPRPRPQRTEYTSDQDMPFFENMFGHGAGGFHFSFGVGTFPFRVLYSTLGNPPRPPENARQQNSRGVEDLLSNVLLYLGVLLMLGVIFAE